MKNKLNSRIAVIVRKFKIAFGILPKTIEEARELFTNADGWWPIRKGPFGIRTQVHKFTPYWQAIAKRWVDLCDSEGEAKGAFFAMINYSWGKEDNPLLTYATAKWLTFLTDATIPYQQEIVWKLSSRWYWCMNSEGARQSALNRRYEFAPVMAENATTYIMLVTAYRYAEEGSPEQAAISARMNNVRKYKTMAGA